MAIATFAGGCGAGETRVDPGDLELSDLLGVAPDVAIAWDADQRASARRVLSTALDDDSIAALDGSPTAGTELVLANEWDGHTWSALPGRGTRLLVALAADAGYTRGPLVISPAPRASSISTFEAHDKDGKLVVNPVVLAAIEPNANELATSEQLQRVTPIVTAARIATKGAAAYEPVTPEAVASSGNPYSFYGSVAECAFAQRSRCESCLQNNTCDPVTDSDGTTECNRLGENNGRGYYLICINLALAISSVENCAIEKASGCARDPDAADSLASLEANANFLDDATCKTPLDACLGEIYGAPPEEFPDLDGGITPPRDPRNTSIDCGDGCNNNNNCDASPNCDCSGPSCNNSFSCDSTCSSSNSGTSCDNCDSCDSTDGSGGCGGNGGGGGGGGGGNCDSSSSGGGGNCNNDCGGGGGGCSGGGCDNSSGGGCGGGGGGGGCSSGGGGGSCNVARRESTAGFALVFSLLWAIAPLPVAMMVKRRSRKRRRRSDAELGMKGEEVAS